MRRGVTAEIDLKAARHNLAAVRKTAGGRPVIAVVKADAYGHGSKELALAFEQAGAKALAVAFVSEARELREAGIKLPILVLFDGTEIPSYFELGLTPVIHDAKTAKLFSREAGKRGVTIDVHLKLDTGMGRLGITSEKDVLNIAALSNVKISGLMSHFSEADLKNKDFMRYQLERFKGIKEFILRKRGPRPLCHMANSAAVLSMKSAHLDAVRPGLILYGCSPFAPESGMKKFPAFRPVMRVKTKVLALRRIGKGQPVSYGRTFITTRKTLAAVISAGYADGYLRASSNNSYVVIGGRKAPVMGRVCMDIFAVDATDAGPVMEGDDVVLLGEGISAWELARAAGTIPYEVMCSLGRNAIRKFRV